MELLMKEKDYFQSSMLKINMKNICGIEVSDIIMYSRDQLIEICKEYLDSNGYKGEYTGHLKIEMPEDMDDIDEVTNTRFGDYFEKKKKAVLTFETIFANRISKPEEISRAPSFVLFINYETGEIDGLPPEM